MKNLKIQQLFSSLEHDLKSPSVSILSTLSLLRFFPDEKITKKTLEKYLLKIEQKAHFSIQLIEDLEGFSSLIKKKNTKKEVVQVSRLLSDICQDKKEFTLIGAKSFTVEGNKEYISKILDLIIREILFDHFRKGVARIDLQMKSSQIKFSYKLEKRLIGASQGIDYGKEKFYYYYLLELLKITKKTIKRSGKKRGMEILLTL